MVRHITTNSRLQDLYNLAKQNGLVHNKKEFSVLIGIDNSTLSHALKEDNKVSATNIIIRAEHALMKAGIPVFENSDNTNWFSIIAEKDKQIKRLLSIIKKMQSN